MKLKTFLSVAVATCISLSTFAAEGDWPTAPSDGQKTDPIGGVIYIWHDAEKVWEVWDVTLPNKGGTGLESPTANQVMVTNGENPFETISYSTLKGRMGLNDAGSFDEGNLSLSVMPATTTDNMLIGNGTGMEEITLSNLIIKLGLENVANVDTTNATNITTGNLSLSVMPQVTLGSVLVGTGTAVEEQTVGEFKNHIALENVANYSPATQVEGEAGTATDKYMTPATTKNAIDAQRAFATQAEVNTGTATNVVISPATLKALLDASRRTGTSAERNALPALERTPGLKWYDTTTDRYYYVNSAKMWMAF